MRAARVESGSLSDMPTITGNEYFAAGPPEVSMITPLASISCDVRVDLDEGHRECVP